MHWYTDVITKHYFDFDGRATRQAYWMFVLFNIIVAIGVGIVAAITKLPQLTGLYSLVVLLPGLGLSVRRLHDTGRSGWWIFISLIPFVGPIILLVFMLLDSQAGDNQYGPNPKGVGGMPAPQPAVVAAATVPPPANAQPSADVTAEPPTPAPAPEAPKAEENKDVGYGG